MRLHEYLTMLGELIESAEDIEDKEKCLRLGMTLQDVAGDYIRKVEDAMQMINRSGDAVDSELYVEKQP